MQATDLRKGTAILYQKDIFVVVDASHRTPGNKRGFMQVSLKSLTNGKIIQNKFSSSETVERAIMDAKDCQYLYHDAEGYHFMDMVSYENFALSEEVIGDKKYFLIENVEVRIDFYDGKPIAPEIPKSVIQTLTESPPWVRGDSVSNNTKPAVTETGLKIQVPIFIQEGEKIKINTETGEYQGRANE